MTVSTRAGEAAAADLNAVGCDLYYLDVAALQELVGELSAHQASFTAFSGKGIDATVDADRDGWLMVSVPREDGWDVMVNGQQVQTEQAFGSALTLVPVTAGHNEVRMRFTSPGFFAGCAVSAASAAGLLLSMVVRRLRGFASRVA